ncbi:copper amine oxidase N-terminal domain-containing protein [Romboutsia lituseburensis]|uniref:copper amine oxidase N-terminal domain-containing protein n=1 Tax=Romboutsia lituseburensis TaxID=1537 RepID=UPI00215B2EC5|nr:copper amine oxidase N-terminal domain-containing protein [Romboutsia lituseburensis]MCR8746782.1 copper amine oxidase N-terminal domain-containing protein [Romboutsia lituseburensis]
MGADISWDRPIVKINYDNNELILKIGSKEAIKNGKTISLEKEPYIYKGRTMVPLRFVSESLGLTVNYRDKKVDIITPKLKINNIEIDSIDNYCPMTMGGILSKNKNNLYATRINNVIEASKTNEVDIDKFSERLYDWKGKEYFHENYEYAFLDKSNNKIAEYKTYTCPDWSDINNPKTICLMEDVTNSKWYVIKTQDLKKFQSLYGIGEWTLISNTVA